MTGDDVFYQRVCHNLIKNNNSMSDHCHPVGPGSLAEGISSPADGAKISKGQVLRGADFLWG